MNYFHRITEKSQRLRDFSRSRQSRFLLRNQGQAMIEYLLMIVVMVMLLVGLTMAFFQPLGDFLTRLNNTYIRCLLETGELPKTGAEGAASCDASLPRFEARNMDGSVPNPEGGGGNGSSENARGESSSADGSSGTEVGGGRGAAGRTTKSSLIRNGMRAGNARPEQAENKTTTIPIDNSFNGGEGFTNSGGSGGVAQGRQKRKRIDISGLTEYDRKKLAREAEKTRNIAVDSESFTQKKNKKIMVKPPAEKPPEDDLNVKTDFSDYFKIFFFIVIILFIIILMGSQAMQMTNNSDS